MYVCYLVYQINKMQTLYTLYIKSMYRVSYEVSIYIYIYSERERERELTHVYIYIYIHICSYMCVYIYIVLGEGVLDLLATSSLPAARLYAIQVRYIIIILPGIGLCYVIVE